MATNQVVTRDQFEVFLAAFKILQHVPEAQRQLLFDVGKNVCQIKNPQGQGVGTGFHLGGGWIMTALHVISDESMRAEHVSEASFHFPAKPEIGAISRTCIFSNFRDAPVYPHPSQNIVKDLALIYVQELLQPEYNTITGLVNAFQEPPQPGNRVYLVHFGGIDGGGDQTPQQFSVNGSVILEQEVNLSLSGNRYSTHNAYCRPGSSGAPLLVFRKKTKKFLLAGVHFAGGKSTGYALWLCGKHWLQGTINVASNIVAKIMGDDLEDSFFEKHLIETYENLQKDLQTQNLRVIVNKSRPAYLNGEFVDIIFRP